MGADIEDVIIIGSGPAGHTAAVYTARADLRPLMFEGFSVGGLAGGQLMTTTEVDNYPGFPEGVSGPELMTNLRKQSERFGTRFLTQDVERVDLGADPSSSPIVVVSDGKEYRTRSLIIATGATARYLGLESEARLLNLGVSACATCDGALPMFRDRPLIVVGGGDTAMEEAIFLTRFASKVTVVHRREFFRASKIMMDAARENPKIEIMVNHVIDKVLGDDFVTGVRLRNTVTKELEEREIAGMFVAIGHKPNTSLFAGQLELDDEGYIVTRGKSSYTTAAAVIA